MYGIPTSSTARGPAGQERSQLRDFWHVVHRNRSLVAAIAAVVIALSALFTWLQDPVYESAVSLQIDAPNTGPPLLMELGPLAGGNAGGEIETDVLVLRSRQIAAAVVDSLHLQVELLAPAVRPDRVIRVLAASPEAEPVTITLRAEGAGGYRVAAEGRNGSAPVATPDRVAIGEPFLVGRLRLALQEEVVALAPEEIRVQVHPYWRTVADLRQQLGISRVDPHAKMVSINFRHTDPVVAAAVPNAAAESFIRFKSRTSRTESRSTVDFLRGQVESYEEQLTEAERNLRDYREREQVVSLGDQASEQVRRLAELHARRDEMRAEQAALSVLLRNATATQPTATRSSPYRQLASFPVFLTNRAVQDILQAITELENQRAELLVLRTAESPDVRGINGRIEELELQLLQIAQSYLGSLETQIASSTAMLAQFDAQLATVPAREIQVARLMRQQTLLAEISTLLQTRLKEAEIGAAVEPGDVRVIDGALVPDRPVAPRPVLNLFLGAVLGVILGLGAVFVRDTLDTKVRTRDDVETATSGMPIIGTIPRIPAPAGAAAAANGRRRVLRVRPEEVVGRHLVTRLASRSPASEAYRALRTNLTFSMAERTPRIVVVTSAMPGDGKSTSSANLAITLAQQGTRTLLIDADLRRGVLNEVFGVEQNPGLTHLLLGHSTLERVTRSVPVDEDGNVLHVLPAGVFPPNPSEVLGSERMRSLIEELRGQYEMVIFDAPPLSLVTDAAVLGTMADASILVTRAGVTDKRALHHAASQLIHVRAPIGGVVFNDIDADTDGGYYGMAYGAEHAVNGSNGAG